MGCGCQSASAVAGRRESTAKPACGCGGAGASGSAGASGAGGAPAPAAGASRVRFRERQLLRADDLAGEQAYHLAMRRRHHLAQHGWGVVRGLRLVPVAGGWAVEPGMAVDGYGRELFVAEPSSLPADAFERLESEALDVWLVYDRAEETTVRRGRTACGPGLHDRWREVSRLRLTAAAEGFEPRAPDEVPLEDVPFAPHREPPDDPAREWPVYLGRVARAQTAPQGPAPPRPSATLAGETLTAPSGRARLHIGSEQPGDARRFAVEVAGADGSFVERLALDRHGELSVHADATLGGDLLFREREPDADEPPTVIDHCSPAPTHASEERAANAVVFTPPTPAPAEAAPWQIYRTTAEAEGKTTRQLRFEIGHPGDKGDPSLYRFAVGAGAGAEFRPCLTLTAACLVTVVGNLVVEGRVVEGPIKADPTDPRFAGELVNQWSRGAAAAGAQLPGTFGGAAQLDVRVSGDDVVQRGVPLNYAVEVENRGAGALSNVHLYVSLAYRNTSDVLVATDQKQAGPFGLAPGAESSAPFNFAPTNTVGTITVSVTAIAVGGLSNVLSAKADKQITVFEPVG